MNKSKKLLITYICEGTCKAKISQARYNKGLTKCGTKTCTCYRKKFTKVIKGKR